jgi:hypothetical protein
MKIILSRFVALSLATVSMTFAGPAFANGFGGGGFGGVSTVVPSLPMPGGPIIIAPNTNTNTNANANNTFNNNANNSTNNNANTFSSLNINTNSNPNTNINTSLNSVRVNTNVGCGPIDGGRNCAPDPQCNNPCILEQCPPSEACQPAPWPVFNNTNNNAQVSSQSQTFNQTTNF